MASGESTPSQLSCEQKGLYISEGDRSNSYVCSTEPESRETAVGQNPNPAFWRPGSGFATWCRLWANPEACFAVRGSIGLSGEPDFDSSNGLAQGIADQVDRRLVQVIVKGEGQCAAGHGLGDGKIARAVAELLSVERL